MKINRIAILGGGTAGWLAANHLGFELSKYENIEITVLESDEVPSIGVGEGTVPFIQNSLRKFGISEAEFLHKCDATFKQGIKFVNWLDENVHGHNYYYHPFDVPEVQGYSITPYMLSSEHAFHDVGIQASVCELGLSPKLKSNGPYEGALSYAYHFDAAKFANLLSENARDRFSVKHKVETVKDATLTSSGDIEYLITKSGERFPYDFYIDCSGFSSLLIGKTLETPFINKDKELLTDTALVQQIPLEEGAEIKPYTTATAHKAGWIWDIPLTTRRGTGFVYSSKYMSEEEALEAYASYLNVDPSSLSPRKLDMKMGYREIFWNKNCVALGLAQGFVEPLEATSILLTDFSAELLSRNFPRTSEEIATFSEHFNEAVKYSWDKTVDFIKLHYCISDRNDSEFWVQNRQLNNSSDELRRRLDKFKIRAPIQSDFFSRFDLFNHNNYLYVLYGMNYPTAKVHLDEPEEKQSIKLLKSNSSLLEQAKQHLMSHKDWLIQLNKAMSKAN